jgi:hypothetical protein
MPIDTKLKSPPGLDLASLRILRLALGTSISLWFSQAVAWDMSFIAPVMTMFILALPTPAPKLKSGIAFVAVLVLSLNAGLLLLPTLLNQPLVGVLLLVLALYWSFYYTAKGGSAVLGTFATMGIAITTAVGTVNLDAVLAVIGGVTLGGFVGILFVWAAHAILPDCLAGAANPVPAGKPAATDTPDLSQARRSAFRSLLIVLPIALWFLLSSASASYTPVMIKVASMGQQASNDATRLAGKSLLMSTVIGGIAAIIAWNLLRIVPSLTMYTLLIGLGGLIMGVRVFQGAAMGPNGSTWSYAYLTMIVILAPAVMDSATGASADVKFWQRLLMFGGTTVYAVLAVYVFDAFKGKATKSRGVPA